jgi:hypothetical protein
MDHMLSERMILVEHDRPPVPKGFKTVGVWGPVVDDFVDKYAYPGIGQRTNIRPKATLVREYTYRSGEILERYIRLGKTYNCCRSWKSGVDQYTEVTYKMRLSEDQKESIAAAAMHPSRLEKWLARGWEDEWDKYFSS